MVSCELGMVNSVLMDVGDEGRLEVFGIRPGILLCCVACF